MSKKDVPKPNPPKGKEIIKNGYNPPPRNQIQRPTPPPKPPENKK